jgi:hypothetical protein
MRVRTLTLASVAIAVVIALAGCGGGATSASASPLKIVSVAADRTAGAHTAKVHISASLTTNGVQHTILRADGVVDFAAGESALHIVFPLSEINGHPDLAFDDRVVAGSVEYISWPGVLDLPAGAQWVRITPDDAGTAAANLQSERADPSAGLQFLRGVITEPQDAGTATVDGAATTRYHVKFDVLKVLERVPKKLLTPSFRAQIDQVRSALQTLGRDSLDGDVWIDGSGRVRRFQYGFSASAGGESVRSLTTLDYSEFGAAVAIDEPPAGTVVPFAQVADQFAHLQDRVRQVAGGQAT